jgi:hypothetical protein
VQENFTEDKEILREVGEKLKVIAEIEAKKSRIDKDNDDGTIKMLEGNK